VGSPALLPRRGLTQDPDCDDPSVRWWFPWVLYGLLAVTALLQVVAACAAHAARSGPSYPEGQHEAIEPLRQGPHV